jgi:Zn-dependent protease
MTETLLLVLVLLPGLIMAIVFHEVAHGWAALMLGDPTAKERRRLTLNPLRHVDPVGTVLVPGGLALAGLPVFGWAKPVPVTQRRLDNPRYGMMAVAAAGPGTNLLLAALAAIALGLIAGAADVAPAGGVELIVIALQYFLLINIFLALFNLLPIPPFDGSHIVEGLLPERAARVYGRLRPFGLGLLVVLLVVIPWLFPGLGVVENLVLPPVEWLRQGYVALAAFVAGV